MRWTTGTLLVLAIGLMAAVVAGTAWWGSYIAQPGPLVAEARVVVAPGSGSATIAAQLEKAGVIGDARLFKVAVRVMGLANTLKAGEYVFGPGVSLRTAVNKLAIGDTANRTVTIPEGWTVKEALARLQASDALVGGVKRPEEGMLFPDTYTFSYGATRQSVLDAMGARMQKELDAAWLGRDTTLPYNTEQDLLTMASIVQKEAANDGEMPQIAAVFVNRLNQHMRLQSDPTVIYGAAAFDGDIKRKDLQDANPFNTYQYAGLPPTPIANPGLAALQAAAHPAVSDALFFVALPDRSGHSFSRTYGEHEKNVKTYWSAVEKAERDAKRAAKKESKGK
ncbi:MAG: endolytic transglycosylase MltG [Proteobacteria bacterium]|nr:endolytic transglycosylase MltG [Pseudomonadota bacterium]